MAIEGSVVDPNATAEPVVDPAKATTDPKVVADPAQGTDPAKNTGWEAEKAAFLRDLQKERKARQAAETKAETHARELDAERKRVQALAGVSPKSDAEAEAEAIRARLYQVVPGLDKLTPEQIERLSKLAESADELEQTRDFFWQRHGRDMVKGVYKAIGEELGGDLTKRQESRIKAAYIDAAENDQEFLRRHYEGDPTLIKEFAKEYLEDWFEPARRKVTSNEVNRNRHVPSGKDRSPVTAGGKAIDVTDPKAVEDLLVEGFRKGGGEFGRKR